METDVSYDRSAGCRQPQYVNARHRLDQPPACASDRHGVGLAGMLVIWLAALLVSGCMRVGDSYQPPTPPVPPPQAYQNDTMAEYALPAPEDPWWRAFEDPAIERLVDRVLQSNLDIRKAMASVLEVRAQFRQTQADRWPSLSVEAGADRSRRYITNPLTGAVSPNTSDTYSLSLPASFEWDLWGRLAYAADALRAQLMAAEENRRTVAQTVVAEAVSLYLQVVSLERQIDTTVRSIDAFKDSLDIVMRRYNKGLTSILDVRQARRTLSQAEASLPLLYQELGGVQQRLALLAGNYPKTAAPRKPVDDYYHPIAPVPPGLPSELLGRRPDILAAEARLRALHAQVGVAYASRFPRITLTGRLGYSSDDLAALFDTESAFWNAAAGLVQPLFDYGKRKAGQRAAEARLQQGRIDYARTVLEAFADVENALVVREQQLQRRELVLLLLEEARATERTARQRYERGLESYLAVLEAQQARLRAELDIIRVEQAIYQNRVALHRALGGGWADQHPETISNRGGETPQG